MLLTFKKKWYCDLIQGRKKQTIRYNFVRFLDKVTKIGYDGWNFKSLLISLHEFPHEVTFINHSDEKLHIWVGNPRNVHLNPRKIGISKSGWKVKFCRGYHFSDHDATKDGFKDRDVLIQSLADINDIFPSDVASDVWAVISWEWEEGPNPYH